MPRPRTVSDDDVLDGVLALAHRVGPAKLTLAAAAREVGLSPATLIQRYGTKHELLLAADRRGVELWVTPVEEAEHPSPLDRIVEGLVGAIDPDMTPEAVANEEDPGTTTVAKLVVSQELDRMSLPASLQTWESIRGIGKVPVAPAFPCAAAECCRRLPSPGRCRAGPVRP